MARHTRVRAFLAMPIAVFLWMIGWTLSFFGSKKKPVKTEPAKPAKQEKLGFVVIAPDEQIESHAQP